MQNTDTQEQYRVRGGLAFEASAFGDIEIAPLPGCATIQVHAGASISVTIGDKVLTGQPITHISDSIVANHATVSGVVIDVTTGSVSIKSDGLDKTYSCRPPELITRHDYQHFFRSMGLVGLGGAAFPVDKKLGATNPSTLLVNAAECDPAIYCDEALMQERTAEVIEGIQIAMAATDVEHCIIGIEDNKTDAIAQLKQHLPENIQLISIPAVYPSGAEQTLLRLCTGKSGSLKENRTICFNVATCYAMYQAVVHSRPLISRIVTVVQDKKARNFEVRIGTPLKDLQPLIGERLTDSLICGGQMMGWAVTAEHCVDKRTNSLITKAGTSHNQVACIRCGACEEVCPESLYPQQLFWHSTPHNTTALNSLKLEHCIECACCDAVCPSHIPLAGLFIGAKKTIQQEQLAQKKADDAKSRYEKHLARQNDKSVRQRRELDSKTDELTKTSKSEDAKKALIAKALQRSKNKKSSASDKNKDHDS